MFVDGWLLFDLGPLQGLGRGSLEKSGRCCFAVFQHEISYGNLMNISKNCRCFLTICSSSSFKFTKNWRSCKKNPSHLPDRKKFSEMMSFDGNSHGFWRSNFGDSSGQIIATSHDLTPNGGLVKYYNLARFLDSSLEGLPSTKSRFRPWSRISWHRTGCVGMWEEPM